MVIKKLYSLLLSVAVIGLASCSTEVSDEHSEASGSATRSFTIVQEEAGEPLTRTNISLTSGITWNAGDRLIAYNVSHPQGYDHLTAVSDGARSKLQGDIRWDEGDELAVFYPFRHVHRENTGKMALSLFENTLYHKGELVVRRQNGTLENFRYFDYAWAKLKNLKTAGKSMWADFKLQRQYAIVRLNVVYDGKPVKNITRVTIKDVYKDAEFDLATGRMTYDDKDILKITADQPQEYFYVALFPDANFTPTYVIETADGEKFHAVVSAPLNYRAAMYYRYTINVSKTECNWVDVDGVEWSRTNLQYEPNTRVSGWTDGYRLAKQPWDYFYAECPFKLDPMVMPNNFGNVAFDHFRWGDINEAHNHGRSHMNNFSTYSGDIQGRIINNKEGDLAYQVSSGEWKLPSKADFENLMARTGEYVGYYMDGDIAVVGVLFDPTVAECLKGKVLDKYGRVIGTTNRSVEITVGKFYENTTRLKKFTKEDLCKGVFFPFAGSYTEYIDCTPHLQRPGAQGFYWTSVGNCGNSRQAVAFNAYYLNSGKIYPGTVDGCSSAKNPRYIMYSIRPVKAK